MCAYAASSRTPEIQICACCVREEGCPARGAGVGWREGGGMGTSLLRGILRMLRLIVTGASGLAAEPPCDFVLKCHQIRGRKSTGSPGRSVSCHTSSGQDSSAPGLCSSPALCGEGAAPWKRQAPTASCSVQSILHFSQEFSCEEPRSFAYFLSKTNHEKALGEYSHTYTS